MSKLASVLIAVSLIGATACNHKDEDRSPRGSNAAMIRNEVALAQNAEASLDVRRADRVEQMKATLAMVAVQEPMLRGLELVLPMTDSGRADVDRQLDKFKAKLDGASTALDQLEESAGSDYTGMEQNAAAAMKAVDDARATAWKSLGDANRPDVLPPTQPPQPATTPAT